MLGLLSVRHFIIYYIMVALYKLIINKQAPLCNLPEASKISILQYY